MPSDTDIEIRELNHRLNDGIDVWLLWNPRTNSVSVSVHDERLDVSFTFQVDGSEALDAFHHPYAYAGRGHRPAEALAA